MADRDDNRITVYGTAVGLLSLGVVLHYGWALVPPEHAAQVWNACSAVARAALLVGIVIRLMHPLVWAVATWWLAEEALVAGCSILYIARPWVVPKGQAQCSSLIGMDMGILGALSIIVLIGCATALAYRWRIDEEL
jgi:hypothetical protein